MKSVPENIWLSKDLFYQLRWNAECLIFYPEIPSGNFKGQQLQQHRQMANALVAVQSLANAIGKCQFVADKINWGIRIDIYTLPCVKKAEHWRTDAFKLWCGRRFSRVPWTARRSNQSILKEIRPEFSLEGLMLKLKLQYFGHLMQKTDSSEKTLMLGKIKGGRSKSKPQWGTITRQPGWLLSKSLQAINAGEDVEKREPSYTVGGNAN